MDAVYFEPYYIWVIKHRPPTKWSATFKVFFGNCSQEKSTFKFRDRFLLLIYCENDMSSCAKHACDRLFSFGRQFPKIMTPKEFLRT